jgi:hypothetical protein
MKKTVLSCAIAALSFGGVTTAPAFAQTGDADEIARLQELVVRQGRLIERLESRLDDIESSRATATNGGTVDDAVLGEIRGRGQTTAQPKAAPASQPGTSQATPAGAATPAAVPAPVPSGTAPAAAAAAAPAPAQPARPAAAPSAPGAAPTGEVSTIGTDSKTETELSYDIKLLARQAPIFEKRLTIETGLQYTRFDRRQLALSGFYALDAIFLGNLSVDQVKAETFTYDATLRYGLTDRIGIDLTVPWVRRESTYLSGGASNAPTQITEERVGTTALGDISLGVSVQLERETRGYADVVGSLRVRLPTGEDPFGIGTRTVVDENGDLSSLTVPDRLPTGSGFRTWQLSLSALKTYDPVVLYANVGYAYSEPASFSDISSGSGVSGEVQAGNALSLGAGMVLALNDTTAYSIGVSMLRTQATKTRVTDGDWRRVNGSSGQAATVNLGVTHALSSRWSLVTAVGIGMTSDTPDYTFSIRFPYRF